MSSLISFHIVIMNWIISLLVIIIDYNTLLIITCKFTKKILLIFDKNIWKIYEWTEIVIIVFINHDWKILMTIVSDRNFRFISNFWKTIVKKFDTFMLIFIAWHFQTNDQFERINQIIKIALRFHCTTFLNDDWFKVTSYLQVENNNVMHIIIDFASNELIYDFKINDKLSMLTNLSSKNFDRLRLIKKKTKVVMTFVNVISKTRYDAHHKTIVFVIQVDFLVYLRLHQKYIISSLINKKLFNQKIDSFKIFETVKRFKQIYRLKLSSIMKIYSIMSITQLESATSSIDSYNRILNIELFSIEKQSNEFAIDNEFTASNDFASHYEIEKLLNKRISCEQSQYLVKWLEYESEHNVWYSLNVLKNAQNLIMKYETKIAATVVKSFIEDRLSIRKRDRKRFKKNRKTK